MDRKLLDLLAIIHRDGGHYVGTHGIDKAVEDAMQIVANRVPVKEIKDRLQPLINYLANVEAHSAVLWGSSVHRCRYGGGDGDDCRECGLQDDLLAVLTLVSIMETNK